MARPTKNGWLISVSRWSEFTVALLILVVVIVMMLALPGCSGLTIGPTIERKAIIVRSGTAIECLTQTTVEARLLKEDGEAGTFEQDVGGWIMMHPDHWSSLKREFERLKAKAGEK